MAAVLRPLLAKKYVRFWLFFTGMVIAAFVFEEVVDDVFSDPQEGDFESKDFDLAIYQTVLKLKSPAMTQVMIDLTALGSVSVNFVLLLIFTTILFLFRDFKGLIYLAVVSAGAGLWPLILKPMFNRPRPDLANHLVNVNDLSFPSGHAFGATAIYIGLAFYAAKYALSWRHELFFFFLGVVLILLVGVSRIYLGVHYPTDVLAGISGGAFWAFFVSSVSVLINARRTA